MRLHSHIHQQIALFVSVLVLALTFSATAVEDHMVKSASVSVKLRYASEEMWSSVDAVIAQQVDLSGDTEPSPALADDLAFFVRRQYLSQGFRKASVEWLLENGHIVIVVDEGIRQKLGKVVFEGNPGLNTSELQRYLSRPTRERIGRFATSTPYVEKEVADGLNLVLRYILSQGYADATVDPPVTTHHDDGTTDVLVTLHPGDQWHIGEVTVEGSPASLEEQIKFESRALRGQPVNDARIENSRRQFEGLLQSQGYFVAKVESVTVRSDGKLMNVSYTLIPGPLHQVTSIELAPSFSRGAARLVRSAFRPAVDHVFDSQRMELAYGRIIDTGIFDHLEMEPRKEGDAALALTFSGEEAKRSTIGLSGGYDTFLGAILGVEYKNVNWWDNGSTLSAKVVGTQLGILAGIQWKNPAVFDSPFAFSIGLKPETFTFDGYTRHTAAIRAAVSRDFSRHLSMELYADSSVNSVSSGTLTDADIGPHSYNLQLAGISMLYEARDNPVAPTRGWFGSLSVEEGYVTGSSSNLSYTRTDFAASWFQPLTNKWRLAIGMHFGSVISSGDVDLIPIELRDYNGGAKGVRSFAERELGPKAKDGTPLGGTQTETVSGEISYELVKNLEIAGFVDVGALGTGKASVLPKFNDLRSAAGLGLRYKLPFGPLRIDYGVNLDKRTGESAGALHIGFGFAF